MVPSMLLGLSQHHGRLSWLDDRQKEKQAELRQTSIQQKISDFKFQRARAGTRID